MIVRFFQRFALYFAILAGWLTSQLLLSDGAEWWLKAAVGLPALMAVYMLLYKDGVTRNRPTRRG